MVNKSCSFQGYKSIIHRLNARGMHEWGFQRTCRQRQGRGGKGLHGRGLIWVESDRSGATPRMKGRTGRLCERTENAVHTMNRDNEPIFHPFHPPGTQHKTGVTSFHVNIRNNPSWAKKHIYSDEPCAKQGCYASMNNNYCYLLTIALCQPTFARPPVCPHLTDGTTEAQGSEVTCSEWQRRGLTPWSVRLLSLRQGQEAWNGGAGGLGMGFQSQREEGACWALEADLSQETRSLRDKQEVFGAVPRGPCPEWAGVRGAELAASPPPPAA